VATPPRSFAQALGLFDASMVVIGGIVGAGIFINPYIVAQRLDSAALVLGAWAAGGAIALVGALAYAELGALFPKAGGQYVYLRAAYHPLVAFLYGWGLLLMVEGGAVAAVAITFAEYANRLAGGALGAGAGGVGVRATACAAIALVSAVNYVGVRPGSRLLNVFVVLKVAALAVLIVAGLASAGSPADAAAPAAGSAGTALAFGAALIPILFSYGGWQSVNWVAEEVRDPTRTLPLGLLLGTAAVVLVYVSVNVAYLRALGLAGLAATTTPAADAARYWFGNAGDWFVTLAITISTFGFLNLCVLAPTRVYYAMAADGVFFPAVARLHPRYRTPSLAIVLQSAWAVVLALSGTYAQLLDYVVFADWIFFGLTVGAVIVLRRTMPDAPRPFRMWGYPLTPALFVAVAASVVASVVRVSPAQSAMGALLLAAGVPAYAVWRRRGGGARHQDQDVEAGPTPARRSGAGHGGSGP
jgi:APA family basic amino acid/polyamine antiporter